MKAWALWHKKNEEEGGWCIPIENPNTPGYTLEFVRPKNTPLCYYRSPNEWREVEVEVTLIPRPCEKCGR